MADDQLKPEDIPVGGQAENSKKSAGGEPAGGAGTKAGGLLFRIRGAPLNAAKKLYGLISGILRLPSIFQILAAKKKPIIICVSAAVTLAIGVVSFHLGTKYSNSSFNPFREKNSALNFTSVKTKPFLILVRQKEPDAFLRMEIGLVSEDSKTVSVIKEREQVLREVIYTFLSRQPESLLRDIKDKKFRMELAGYINTYIGKGKIKDVLFARCGYI